MQRKPIYLYLMVVLAVLFVFASFDYSPSMVYGQDAGDSSELLDDVIAVLSYGLVNRGPYIIRVETTYYSESRIQVIREVVDYNTSSPPTIRENEILEATDYGPGYTRYAEEIPCYTPSGEQEFFHHIRMSAPGLATPIEYRLECRGSDPDGSGSNFPIVEVLSGSTTLPAPDTSIGEPLPQTFRNDEWSTVRRALFGVETVLVPPGCFEMGRPGSNSPHDYAHDQCIDTPFWIDQTEATVAQFDKYRGVVSVSTDAELDNILTYGDVQTPARYIQWRNAYRYCEIRGGRLPTEVEWEYAARGPDSLEYPWGNVFNSAIVAGRNNTNFEPLPVGSFPDGASWVDALDMSGNVAEFTSSQGFDYPYDPVDGREEPTGTGVVRGGSFQYDVYTAHDRDYIGSDWSDAGVRCVFDVEGIDPITVIPDSKPRPNVRATIAPTATPTPSIVPTLAPGEAAIYLDNANICDRDTPVEFSTSFWGTEQDNWQQLPGNAFIGGTWYTAAGNTIAIEVVGYVPPEEEPEQFGIILQGDITFSDGKANAEVLASSGDASTLTYTFAKDGSFTIWVLSDPERDSGVPLTVRVRCAFLSTNDSAVVAGMTPIPTVAPIITNLVPASMQSEDERDVVVYIPENYSMDTMGADGRVDTPPIFPGRTTFYAPWQGYDYGVWPQLRYHIVPFNENNVDDIVCGFLRPINQRANGSFGPTSFEPPPPCNPLDIEDVIGIQVYGQNEWYITTARPTVHGSVLVERLHTDAVTVGKGLVIQVELVTLPEEHAALVHEVLIPVLSAFSFDGVEGEGSVGIPASLASAATVVSATTTSIAEVTGQTPTEIASTPEATPLAVESCPGTLPLRMVVGQRGKVSAQGVGNRVRSDPGLDGNYLFTMERNSEFAVVGGPVCEDGYTWWQVDFRSQVGWTAEADDEEYWLEPLIMMQAGTALELAQTTVVPSGIFSFRLPNGWDWSETNSGEVIVTVPSFDNLFVGFVAPFALSNFNLDSANTSEQLRDGLLRANGGTSTGESYTELPLGTAARYDYSVSGQSGLFLILELEDGLLLIYAQGNSATLDSAETTILAITQTLTYDPTAAQAAASAIDCSVSSNNTVNVRSGPGTTFDQAGTLAAGQSVQADGKAQSTDGFVWWRLVDGRGWLREDVVVETGECDRLPLVDPQN